MDKVEIDLKKAEIIRLFLALPTKDRVELVNTLVKESLEDTNGDKVTTMKL